MADFESCRRDLREDRDSFVSDEDVVSSLNDDQLEGLKATLSTPENRRLHKDLLLLVVAKVKSLVFVHG